MNAAPLDAEANPFWLDHGGFRHRMFCDSFGRASQWEIAHAVGLNQSTVSSWFNGEHAPTVKSLLALAYMSVAGRPPLGELWVIKLLFAIGADGDHARCSTMTDAEQALQKFALAVIRQWVGDGERSDLDGYWLETTAVKTGVCSTEQRVTPCRAHCPCAEIEGHGETVECLPICPDITAMLRKNV